jgi:Phosphoglucomutase/phosphomannomutase, alpha/beta/alpha domain I
MCSSGSFSAYPMAALSTHVHGDKASRHAPKVLWDLSDDPPAAALGKTNGDRRKVLLAHDTRPSATELIAAAAAGVQAAGCTPVECGEHSITPPPAALSSRQEHAIMARDVAR